MTQAFATTGPINVAVEQGLSGKDEQEGFRFICYASPAVGPLVYTAARYAWRRALRRYESGSG